MVRSLPVLLLCFALFSCGAEKARQLEEQVKLPADSIIPEELMIQLLADVHILEAGLQIQRNKGIDPDQMVDVYYEGLFKKYGITRSQFDRNMAWYRSDPDQFEKFYEKVEKELDNRSQYYFSKPATKGAANKSP